MLYYTNIGRTGFLDKSKIKEIERKGPNIGPKPITGGLWCMRAGHADGWETYTHAHQMHQVLSLENAEISTKEDARILIIDSKQALDKLLDYAIPEYQVDSFEFEDWWVDEKIWEKSPIDWAKVAQDYDVVEFRKINA